MNPNEYTLMRAVEDRHWWYRGLRATVWETWNALPPAPGGKPLLDIGCGTGGTLATAPCTTVGLDVSVEALDCCRERGATMLVRADVQRLPFRDGSFSGALLLDVLYHRAVPAPAAALEEARRVVVPGGHVLLNVPAYEWLRSSHDEAIHTGRRFTRADVRTLLVEAGLDIIRLTYWNSLMLPLAAGVRIARKRSRRASSDLQGSSAGPAAAVAGAALSFERALLRHVDLPAGLSVFAVGRRPESAFGV